MEIEIRDLIQRSISLESRIRAFRDDEANNRLFAVQQQFNDQEGQPGIEFQLFL